MYQVLKINPSQLANSFCSSQWSVLYEHIHRLAWTHATPRDSGLKWLKWSWEGHPLHDSPHTKNVVVNVVAKPPTAQEPGH